MRVISIYFLFLKDPVWYANKRSQRSRRRNERKQWNTKLRFGDTFYFPGQRDGEWEREREKEIDEKKKKKC